MNTIKKARIQLTLLNGGVTTLILVIMTCGYMFISENSMMRNKMYAYQSDIYTICSYIEQQDIISNAYLSQLESGNKYYVSLLDNGTEFLFNINKVTESGKRRQVVDRAWDIYFDEKAAKTNHTISYKNSYTSYIMESDGAKSARPEYLCFVINIEKKNAKLEILLAAPLETIRQEITRQRLLFSEIIALALTAIWIFAWIFTGKLLNPIEKSRNRQNQFIASASHELRTPLAVILSCAESGFEKEPSPELSTIKKEALRTSRLLNDMLTLLSCDAGHLDIKPVSTQLDTLVLNVCEAFESMAAAKRIKITASLPEEMLPDCMCDNERMVQVLTIFVHNAISYTPEGGQVCLSVHYHDAYHHSPSHSKLHFEIRISDTGVGISDEEKSKIFDRFYRSEKARSDKNHFGLGLSIAYDIITAHRGAIKVTDTPSGGTTFIIMLR